MTHLTSRLISDENQASDQQHVLSTPSAGDCAAKWILCQSQTEEFSGWIDRQLDTLEMQFEAFVTRNSWKHSMGR